MFNTIIQKTAVQYTVHIHTFSHTNSQNLNHTHRAKEHTITIAHIALTNLKSFDLRPLWLHPLGHWPLLQKLVLLITMILWHCSLFTARNNSSQAQEQQKLPELWAHVDLKVNFTYLLMIALPQTHCHLSVSIRVLSSTVSTMIESTVLCYPMGILAQSTIRWPIS